MTTQTPFAIFSAQLAGLDPAVNAGRNDFLRRELQHTGLDFQAVLGSYKGVEEQSFLVLLPHGDFGSDFVVVERLSRKWEQESFLFVDGQRQSSLHYSDGRVEMVGVFSPVTRGEAAQLDGWTQDAYGSFYAVLP